MKSKTSKQTEKKQDIPCNLITKWLLRRDGTERGMCSQQNDRS